MTIVTGAKYRFHDVEFMPGEAKVVTTPEPGADPPPLPVVEKDHPWPVSAALVEAWQGGVSRDAARQGTAGQLKARFK